MLVKCRVIIANYHLCEYFICGAASATQTTDKRYIKFQVFRREGHTNTSL